MILTCKTRKQIKQEAASQLDAQADDALRNMRRLIRAEECEIEFWFRMREAAPNDTLRALYEEKLDHQAMCLVRWRGLMLIAEIATQKRRELQKLITN